ncbi:neurotransmitter:Na+ symporter, NSS family [Dethiosulfatibacter aminovorans DSM 17477]|uniref:Transporter n=1 Tax=Dethiosulfatibacter aminovorans DSM 17477 TaxID=1121476 RepID=A0A1M6GN92_9FIRM|nr:sodium-dependent transporter [Dethiosulfatibacter aminovorans]SHJ11408.1 neurotransmitter:Na+ symporter, NSS family [Dethiosulfatibacter aminovorans DSM 17477]
MNEQRGQWGSRLGFILAAIGSAVGLGNIWRFPYTASSNGGGAFLIPYLFALLTAGIPILILEFAIAHKIKKSVPGVFGSVKNGLQSLGWIQTFVSISITVYYTVIIGWSMNYAFYALSSKWGTDTSGFFFGEFLNITDSPFNIGHINKGMLLALAAVWLINYFVLSSGIKAGIEKANKIFMPLLVACLVIVAIRGITLEGAVQGLDYFFKPEFSKLSDPTVWLAAYGQIFYSLSICFGIMITYASYLPEKTDIVNNAFMTGLGNCSFSILAGMTVFSVLGYMAAQQGVSVAEVSAGGIGLAFIVFPKAINALPGMNGTFGAIFFLCLIFAGLSSSMSIIEVIVSSIQGKFDIARKKVLRYIIVIGFLISLIFVTGAGLYILDIVDHFVNTYAIALAGLVEILVLAYMVDLEELRSYANGMSDFAIGKWWIYTLKYLTPALLAIMFVFNTYVDFTKGYEGYSLKALMVYGVGTLVFIVVGALVFNRIKGEDEKNNQISRGDAV